MPASSTTLPRTVLVKQPSHVVEFLIDASILGELEPEVCSLVSGRDDSADILSKLSASGLFVYMTSSGGYRFHNLLKDHLQRLCRKDLARWVDANRKAADYYWETGEGLQAVDHLIAAGTGRLQRKGYR